MSSSSSSSQSTASTESSSSSTSAFDDLVQTWSSNSSGSQSESSWSVDGSESSESSADVTWYSQLVVLPVRRNLVRLIAQLQIDLNLVDQRYVSLLGPQELEVGFSHNGTYYAADTVVFEDGARPTLVINPRQAPTVEDQILASWLEQMLGRIRGILSLARTEGDVYFDIRPEEYRIV